MRRFSRLLLALVVFALPAGARAQFRAGYFPGAGFDYGQTQAAAAVVGATAGANAAFRYSPYAYGWGPYQYQTPTNGFLTGAADVMNASGQYMIQNQQANMGREQVKSAHIDNRRKMFDELRYERENTPTQWQRQAADRQEQLMQARTNPPLTEIWEGISLNLLLDDIRQIQASTGLRGAIIPLDPDILPHISLTTGSARQSSTMLANGGNLKWPPALDEPRFDETRKQITQLFAQATKEAGSPDGLDGQTRRQLKTAIDRLQNGIDDAVADMSPTDNIRAKTFANQVAASARLLDDPNVAKTINGDWAARGATVDELIANMTRNGQRFGPAGPADKPFYTSLYYSVLQYNLSLMQMARIPMPSPTPGAPPSPGLRP
jgi:hypothetical protein